VTSQRACVICGAETTCRNTCGPECLRARLQQAAQRSAEFRRGASNRRRACAYCDQVFLPRGGVGKKAPKRFCSRACYAAWQSKIMRLSINEIRRRAEARQFARVARLTRQCLVCGRGFAVKTQNAKQIVCSDQCLQIHRVHLRSRSTAPCKECGRVVQRWNGHGRPPMFCSDRCCRKFSARAGHAMRRARERSIPYEVFNPLEIFGRDGWRCQLCGRETPPHLRGSHSSSAPELDHIVPLSRGGFHTRANCQTSCRWCNRNKGAAMPGEERRCA